MIYSCFNERLGAYEYFEDDRGHALNGDLPVPTYPQGEAGSVGVPARDAGRPLPSGARRVGTGWHARGMVVRCSPLPLKGVAGGTDATNLGLRIALLVTGGVLAMYGAWRIYLDSMGAR